VKTWGNSNPGYRELCQCGPFISPTLMETKWKRLKRTQTRSWYNSRLVKAKKSQKEVLKSKPSTASSDEEKLAAGISTIRKKNKRLSGAQRKNS
jgi:hypothetical protein